MNTFSPGFNDLKSNLKQMLLKGINSFEDGFEILDIDLELDESLTIDVLAKDSRDNPTVILMSDADEENLMHRTLNTLCHLRKFRFLLQRIYQEHSFDFSVPPRILLLSSRFSDNFVEKLDFIVAGDIIPYEYSMLKIESKEYMTFSRRDIEDSGEITVFPIEKEMKNPTPVKTEKPAEKPAEKPTPQPVAPKAEPAKPAAAKPAVAEPKKAEELKKAKKKPEAVLAERFFHEAKKKILRISNDIVESVDEPYSYFKINNRILVTLSVNDDEFAIYLGDHTERKMKIKSEDQLNEALNQIFKRYFTAFSSISKT